MLSLNQIEQHLAKTVNNISGIPEGAYNFRLNGKSIGRASTKNINVVPREDKQGINVYVAPNTKDEAVHILVMLKESGLQELVKSDFYIGRHAEVTIIAGCGIYNCGASDSKHDGLHNFYLKPGAKVHYIEKLYGTGPGAGKILNPATAFFLQENAEVFAEIEQIRGIDSSTRTTRAELAKNAKIEIKERTLTQARQLVQTSFDILLNGVHSSAKVSSRTVAEDFSSQTFHAKLTANQPSKGYASCDAILKDHATAHAVPELLANHPKAELVHEAAIGQINHAQIQKLLTLGFTPRQAESLIINGFLS